MPTRPVLFTRPERRFTYLQAVGVPFHEGLVIPFAIGGKPIATIWIVTHDPGRHFDGEDVRAMQLLATFASRAYDAATSDWSIA